MNESIEDDLSVIKEIFQSWLDDLSFDILPYEDNLDYSGFLSYVIENNSLKLMDIIDIYIEVFDKSSPEYKEAKNNIENLLNALRANFDIVHYGEPLAGSKDKVSLKISIVL